MYGDQVPRIVRLLKFYDGELLLLLCPIPVWWLDSALGEPLPMLDWVSIMTPYYLVVGMIIWMTSGSSWRRFFARARR